MTPKFSFLNKCIRIFVTIVLGMQIYLEISFIHRSIGHFTALSEKCRFACFQNVWNRDLMPVQSSTNFVLFLPLISSKNWEFVCHPHRPGSHQWGLCLSFQKERQHFLYHWRKSFLLYSPDFRTRRTFSMVMLMMLVMLLMLVMLVMLVM